MAVCSVFVKVGVAPANPMRIADGDIAKKMA
jgi:hypothetical protein